jgi:hypothetical protein
LVLCWRADSISPDRSSPIAVSLLVIVPVAAFAVVALAQRFAPGWAEAHERNRSVDERLLRVERGLGCLFGLVAFGVMAFAIVYLWVHRPPW